MHRIVLRLLVDTCLVALCLFVSAGTLQWWRAWVLLMVMLCIRVCGAIAVYRVNPALIRERARLPLHRAQPWADRVLLLGVLGTGFLGLPVIAALDVFRWRLLPTPVPLVSAGGLLLFAIGWTLKSAALRTNAFATTVVRVQSERAHVVSDSGLYAVVRHPFYAADPLILIGLSLWLESLVAAVGAVVALTLMVGRLLLEERFLRRELPGYREYVERVPHRLIPGIW